MRGGQNLSISEAFLPARIAAQRDSCDLTHLAIPSVRSARRPLNSRALAAMPVMRRDNSATLVSHLKTARQFSGKTGKNRISGRGTSSFPSRRI